MEGRRRKRVLSKEEMELWTQVTRHDTPLPRLRGKRIPEAPSPDPTQIPPGPAAPAVAPAVTQAATASGAPALQAPKNGQAAPLPAPFDHREARRIARGRREIDARLDLHGLRQQDAHAALRRFLAQAQSRGYRHVLIITGKGKSDPAAERDFWTTGERGILRRLVPQWLCDPTFRPYVVSYLESALHHGGSGALYVTIRKGRRPGQGKEG